MPHHVLNKKDFDQQLTAAGSKLVVVDFFATWCGPCKMIAPALEELEVEFAADAVVLKVDVDECEEIAVEYNISSMPTFVFIKDGQQIHSFSGASKDKLRDCFSKYTS